ncbi:MAG: RHS repeat-associated core domain-containing protein [Streptosporangiaceae bacterium]
MVEVTLTNTTASTWPAADDVLSYHWAPPDGTDVTTDGNRLETALPEDVSPGETVTVQARVRAPTLSDSANVRAGHVLSWDLRDTATGEWLSESAGVAPLPQKVAVADASAGQLGLEDFYSYSGTSTGAGSAVVVNAHAGNAVFSYDAFAHPSRGLATFVRMAYNSLDTSDSAMGYGWSLQTSTLMRLGSPLDLSPRGRDWPARVTLIDGDGTSQVFALNKHGSTDSADWTYDHPPGVHYYLQKTGSGDPTRAWVMTRPDRTRFYFDADGWLSAIADNNGNELTFTYAERSSHNRPRRFLTYITDAAGRRTLTVDYYEKGQAYDYYDGDTKAHGDKLTNPKIIDKVESITGIAGRTIGFTYSDNGLLRQMADGAGSGQPKRYTFGYDEATGTSNVKLRTVTDPRGHTTTLGYDTAPEHSWLVKTISDRRGGDTTFDYADPDGSEGHQVDTTVTDAKGNATVYRTDGRGRPTRITDAEGQVMSLRWETDNNVTRLEEAGGAVWTWAYDPKTGYPTRVTDAEANANGTASTRLSYRTGLDGHVADLTKKVSPAGRTWTFGYDDAGNLTSVTDPKGNATQAAEDYTTSYAYNSYGELTQATDPDGNTTAYGDYGPTGSPGVVTDPLGEATHVDYDGRGNVLSVTDAAGHTSSYTYDVFDRPLRTKVPKDQSKGVYIVTPAPSYDANDNVTTRVAPNGAVTTHAYNPADQVVSTTLPANGSGKARTIGYDYDTLGELTSVTEPKGTLTDGDDGDFTTSYAYDPLGQLVRVTDAKGEDITYAYDEVGNLTTVVDPKKNASDDPDDYTTKYVYDLNHRVTSVTDAGGYHVGYGYDLDGYVTAKTDKAGHTTHVDRGERGLVTRVRVPLWTNADDEVVYRTTSYGYDQAGNRTKVVMPRGQLTPDVDDDFTHRFVYDPLNRVRAHVFPYDPADSRYNAPHKVTYGYDQVGNLTSVSYPPSKDQQVRTTTMYGYFDNGWIKSSTDPWHIRTAYDYNDLGEQTSRTVTAAGGSTSHTMGWAYWPDGSLRTRSDAGIPAGTHVVLVDNAEPQHTDTTGSWDTSSAGSGFVGFDYATHPKGHGGSVFTWSPYIPADGSYEVFAHWPAVDGAASDAPYTIGYDGGTTTKRVDQTANAGQWVSLGSYEFTGRKRYDIGLANNADGTVVADAVKLVRDTSGETDGQGKAFGYGYDPNGNLTAISDSSAGAEVDAWRVAYTALNRVRKVTARAGGSVKHTTSFGYDPNGNVTSRVHDGARGTYAYSPRDLVEKVVTDVGTANAQTTTFGYNALGLRKHQVKGNGTTVDYRYYRSGQLDRQVEKTAGGALVASHDLDYNAAGLLWRDEQRLADADSTRHVLARDVHYSWTPRGRARHVTRIDPATGETASSEHYGYDPAGNMIHRTLGGVRTVFDYNRNRLVAAESGGKTVASYDYDPYGRLHAVTAGGKTVESYAYDGFNRTTRHRKRQDDGDLATTAYSYDPLDRTTAKTTDAGTGGAATTTFGYLGLSSQVIDEQVAGKVQRSYAYGPFGRRLSMVKRTGSGGTETSFFGYSPHADVETLTDTAGDTRGTYGYTAYGQPDTTLFTGVDKPDPNNPDAKPYNVYRFDHKRLDPGTGSYDMGFRDYSPQLGRYRTRDLYAGALADLRLTTDPWTSNRYALAGGNPVTRIELDGHVFSPATGAPGVGCQTLACPTSGGTRPRVQHIGRGDFRAPTNSSSGGGGGPGPAPSPAPQAKPAPVPPGRVGPGPKWGNIHTALDVFGLFGGPVFGIPFDLSNCGLYAAGGHRLAASASCLGAVPVIGTAAVGGRYGYKGGKAIAKGIGEAAEAGEAAGSLTSRAARREAMRQFHIPTSQQPVRPYSSGGHRAYVYAAPRGTSVPRHAEPYKVIISQWDKTHGYHWEAGWLKGGGEPNRYGMPRLVGGKGEWWEKIRVPFQPRVPHPSP